MNIEHDLQLVCVTYNRHDCLKETFDQLLSVNSPVRNCDFLILDNASTDGTSDLIREVMRRHKNVRTIRHNRNVGGNANIARAMEESSKKYLWILGDDDYFDFSNWNEAVKAMERGERVICLSRYILPDEHKEDLAWQLVQTTFITGVIVSAELHTDTVMAEVYNHVHTLFPQIVPVMHHVNHGGRIYVVDRPIVFNGDDGTQGKKKDLSYTRGQDANEVSPYTDYMRWENGWAMACAMLKDPVVRESAVRHGLEFIFGRVEEAIRVFMSARINNGDVMIPLVSPIAVQLTGSHKQAAFDTIRYIGNGTVSRMVADARHWYRYSGMNDLGLKAAAVICLWHLVKLLNPWSSLHKLHRNSGDN